MIQLPIPEGEIVFIPGVTTPGFYNPQMLPKLESDWLLGKVQGLPCTLRISSLVAGFACSDASTVIPAHVGALGKGMSTKVSDLEVCAACYNCHALLDRVGPHWSWLMKNRALEVSERARLATAETRAMLMAKGHIMVPHGYLTK